ncbi:MAG: dihydroorotate dehydrogenase [Verrucomicrobiaceae bacterium]|nr:dihydroorotate dehydrogenase [Verrucomicrobiaceae bacterium]
MYGLLRELLFRLPTETSHHLSLDALQLAAKLGVNRLIASAVPRDVTTVMGIEFPNRIGLAAGLDKNGDYIEGLVALGFGFIEIGTVTPRPQTGNPQPRLFRLPQARAIINRMGFNNQGVDYLVEKVKSARGFLDRNNVVLGINIGKNKDTAAENAVDDYLICMRKVYAHASYITVNLSSPNTPGLRDLQFGDPLKNLLERLKQEQHLLANTHGRYVPLTVKIAPDMAADDIHDVAGALMQFEIDGVIATNTTIARDAVKDFPHGNEAGGLSGAPLTQKSTQVIHALAQELDGKLPIIGVGGIMSGSDAAEKIKAGAALVQIYSGFIYRGPDLIAEAARALRG